MHSSCKEAALVFRGSITLVVNRRRSPRSRFPRTFVRTFHLDRYEVVDFDQTDTPRIIKGEYFLEQTMGIKIQFCCVSIRRAINRNVFVTTAKYLPKNKKKKKKQYCLLILTDFVQEAFFRNKLKTMIIPGQRR